MKLWFAPVFQPETLHENVCAIFTENMYLLLVLPSTDDKINYPYKSNGKKRIKNQPLS